MESTRKAGLVLSNMSQTQFGEVLAVSDDPKKFWAIISYKDEAVFIRNRHYFELFEAKKMVPGSISIKWSEKITYQTDDLGNHILDEKQKKIPVGTGEFGWTLIDAVGLEELENNSRVKVAAQTTKIREKTQILRAHNEYNKELQIGAQYLLGKDETAEIEARLSELLGSDPDEDDEETEDTEAEVIEGGEEDEEGEDESRDAITVPAADKGTGKPATTRK